MTNIKIRKSWILLIVIGIFFISIFTAMYARAEEDLPVLSFKAVNESGDTITSAKAGETFNVEIGFADECNYYTFYINYDSSLFEFISSKMGTTSAMGNLAEIGEYRIADFNGQSVIKVADGKLATLTFKVKQDAESNQKGDITLSVQDFGKGDDEEINYKYVNDLKNGFSVAEKEVSGIEVSKQPNVEYLEGKDTIDYDDYEIKVSYDNGTSENLKLSANGVSVTGFDNTKVGEQTLTVNYGGKTCTFKVTVKAKSVEKIEITKPTKSSYYQDSNETLDLAGGSIKVTYDNGTTENILLSDLDASAISGFSTAQSGDCEVTVTYGEKTDTFKVNIIAKAVTGIAVDTLPTKTSYIQDEALSALDLSGGKVVINYNNGKSETLDMTDSRLQKSGFDTAATGKNTITLTYNDGSQDWTCTFDVTITVKGVKSISLAKAPTKDTYLEGKDDLDLTGGEITVNYDNNQSEKLSMSAEGVSVTGFDNTKVGEQTLTVNYGGKTCTFKVTVKAKSVEKIEITKPSKLSYYQDSNETLDLAGGSIKVTYDNGTTENILLSDLDASAFSGFSTAQSGDCEVTVTYGEKTDTFKVNIIAKAVTGIAVDTLPTKTSYIQDEALSALDLSGGKVVINYNNGKSETLDMTDSRLQKSGFDTAATGKNTITLTYNDGSQDWTCTFDVTITVKGVKSISLAQAPTKDTYLEGKDELDLTGGEITVKYDNNQSEKLSMSAEGVSVTGFDNTKVGEQTLTVNYGGKTCTFKVTVKAKSVEKIEITKPTKSSYYQDSNETLDLTGGSVKAIYDNGDTLDIDMNHADVTVTGYSNAKAGTNTITVTYAGKSETFDVIIIAKAATSIKVQNLPTKTNYYQDEKVSKPDLTGGAIIVSYNNGQSVSLDMTDSNIKVSGFDMNQAGTKTLTLTYKDGGEDCTCSFNVFVISVAKAEVVSANVSEEKAGTYQLVVESVEVNEEAIAAVETAAKNLDVSQDIDNACEELGIDAENAVIAYTPSFQISLIDEDSPLPENGELESFTIEITPVVNVKVTDSTDATNSMEFTKELVIEEPVEITIQLPEAFINALDDSNVAYVQHQHDENTPEYEYIATVENGKATFTSNNGCSPFTIATTSHAEAEVDGIRYVKFKDALNAVKGTEKEIILLKDVSYDFTADEIGEGLAFTINLNGYNFNNTLPDGYKMDEKSDLNQSVITYTIAKEGTDPVIEDDNPEDIHSNSNTYAVSAANTGISSRNISLTIAAALALMGILIAMAYFVYRRKDHSSQE